MATRDPSPPPGPRRRAHGRRGSRLAGLAALVAGLGGGGVLAREGDLAVDHPGFAGDYVCKADCRYSDAPPSIAVTGSAAQCRSELGGVFEGRVLSRTSVFCFNMIGTLSADGTTIRWSNGGLWVRRR